MKHPKDESRADRVLLSGDSSLRGNFVDGLRAIYSMIPAIKTVFCYISAFSEYVTPENWGDTERICFTKVKHRKRYGAYLIFEIFYMLRVRASSAASKCTAP